jgi:chromosome segregation ATPase
LIGIRERLARFPKQLAEVEGRVTTARQKVATAKESLLTGQKERKTYEMDVEQWKERAKKYRNQSGEVKTNEAYRALLHEIENAEREVASAEDRLLERMVSGEEYDRQVKAAEASVKEIEAAANKDRQAIQAEYNAAQKELSAAEAARAIADEALRDTLLREFNESSFSLLTDPAMAALLGEEVHLFELRRAARQGQKAQVKERIAQELRDVVDEAGRDCPVHKGADFAAGNQVVQNLVHTASRARPAIWRRATSRTR